MMIHRPAHWLAIFCLLMVNGAPCASPALAQSGSSGASVRFAAEASSHAVRIEAVSTGPFEYKVSSPSENFVVADLLGVTSSDSTSARVLASDVVSSYRVIPNESDGQVGVRLEVLLRAPVEPRFERANQTQLALIFENAPGASVPESSAAPQPSEAASGSAGVLIRRVQIGRTGEQTNVRIEGTSHLQYEALRLSNPERVVLDFAGARLANGAVVRPASIRPVSRVRVSQFKPDVARVVIDLASAAPHSTQAEGNSVTVAFSTERDSPRTVKPVSAKSSEVSIAQAVPAKLVEPSAQPQQDPPASNQQSRDAGESKLLASPDPAPQGNDSKARPTSQEATAPKAEMAAQQSPPAEERPATGSTAATPTPAPPQEPSPQPAAPGATKYSGEPISVNLKDVDLKDFFRLIHEISGLNVVLDPNVKGSLTIVLDEVPWDQALEVVLRNNNLDKQLEGNVLRVATRETLKKEAEIRRDLAKAQAEAIEQVTTTRVLSYAKATGLRDTLKRFLSSRGEILADERANMLIIRDIPSVLPVLDNLIRQLDRKGQQVEIEARVVAASRSFARDIGTQFGFATSAAGGRTVFGGLLSQASSVVRNSPPLPVPPLVVASSSSSTGNSIPLNVNLPASVPTSGFTFAHSSPNLALDFIISAAESKGVGKLLSKPKVITQNNEKATVKQGTKIPVQTTINNTISVQFIDAVLKLEVTPQITAEGTVFMEVVVENTQIAQGVPRVQGIPALDTQAAESKVLINDGGTVVIGGINISSQRTDIQQVPLFGSLPLIGNLFKRTTVNVQSQELLFFLTPRIAPN